MIAEHYTHSQKEVFTRRVIVIAALIFGLFALFFMAIPSLGSQNKNTSASFFTQNTAHADTPHTPDVVDYTGAGAGDGGGAGCGGGAGAGGCSR